MTENGRARKLSMFSWNRQKFQRRPQRRVISAENGGYKGGSAAGVARASTDQYFISTSATSDRRSSLFPAHLANPTFPTLRLLPLPSRPRVSASRHSSPRRVFPCFLAFLTLHPVSPSLSPHSLPPSSLISLFRFKPRWLCHRAEPNRSRMRDVLRYDHWSLRRGGSFKNSQLIARRAKMKYPRGSKLSLLLMGKLSFMDRASKLEIRKHLADSKWLGPVESPSRDKHVDPRTPISWRI